MALILIMTIITILIINTINQGNKNAETSTLLNISKYRINNIFYKVDTKFTNQISFCSVQQLETEDMDNSTLDECFLVPDIIKNKNYSISNDNDGEYKITYTFDYNKFSTNINNKNKTVIDNNDGTITVTKNYNNTKIDLNLLKEIASFIPGTYLTADSLGDSDDITFYSNVTGKYYSKESYYSNGVTIFDKNYPDNQQIYVSEYNDNLMYVYDSTNKKITIFSSAGSQSDLIDQIEYLLRSLLPKYTVTNTDTTDGNGEIEKN